MHREREWHVTYGHNRWCAPYIAIHHHPECFFIGMKIPSRTSSSEQMMSPIFSSEKLKQPFECVLSRWHVLRMAIIFFPAAVYSLFLHESPYLFKYKSHFLMIYLKEKN